MGVLGNRLALLLVASCNRTLVQQALSSMLGSLIFASLFLWSRI